MNLFKAVLDTRNHNGVVGKITQFDTATLEFQIVTDGQINEAWESPTFELIAMKRDENPVRETDQSRFTILSKETHEVQVELKEQFLTCRGNVKMQLIVKDGDRLSTSVFYIIVGESLDHGIVESHRDVAVLDELEQYVKTGYDALAYQEQRLKDVENMAHGLDELDELMKENEIQRQETLNQQLTSQRQTFDDSQNEREREFDRVMSSNQAQFNHAESLRANTFNNSQIENERVFTANENARQILFNTNEAVRETNETSRVTAEAERQKKMSAFEAKATQLSNELDAQVERVDAFVTANEEKLLGDRDKVDYMGNTHKSVKAASDANVDWLLGEVNTAHYEGQHITATDTIEGHAKSAILKGNTMINLFKETSRDTQVDTNYLFFKIIGNQLITLKPNTQYTLMFDKYIEGINTVVYKTHNTPLTIEGYQYGQKFTFTTLDDVGNAFHVFIKGNTVEIAQQMLDLQPKIIIIEGDHSSVDSPYFEGMQSVKMPVLKTTGKNLFDGLLESGRYTMNEGTPFADSGAVRTVRRIKVKPSTKYTLSVFGDGQLRNISEYNNGTYVGGIERYSSTYTFETSAKTNEIHISFQSTDLELKAQLEENLTATSYEPHKSNILTVNEPVELRGIGDVKDELNLMTGEVIQKIQEFTLDGYNIHEDYWYTSTSQYAGTETYYISTRYLDDKLKPHGRVISNLLPEGETWNTDYECVDIQGATNGYMLRFRVNKTKLSELSINGFIEFLKQNPITIYYELATKSVKTVDLSDNVVYSYDEVTHYDCSSEEGSLVPTLSVDVPTNLPALVSRQRATIENQKTQIQTLETENEQLIEQNQVQDEDIALNQDAINFMLFASEMLADDNNKTKGVNTMAAYLANQILKGKLDYSLVVSRYPQFKEDIDTILILEGEENLIK